MDNKEIINSIKERITSQGLMISRVPNNTRENFIKIANEDFAGDYGLLLKYLLEQTLEYQRAKSVIFILEENLTKLGMNSEKEVANK